MRTSGSTTCSSALPNSGGIFDAAKPEQELARLEAQASAPDFWNNQVEAQKVLQRRRRLDEDVTLLTSLRQRSDDLTVLREWLEAGEPVGDDLMRGLDALRVEVEAGEIKKMLGGEHDTKNAIITVHPGAGGTESQDWAEMILRMYLRWAERRGFKREVLDFQPGDEAGVKSATLTVSGEFAYGLLSAEAGVHRLVRISPFDQAARRHTSFASLYVWPELPDDVDVAFLVLRAVVLDHLVRVQHVAPDLAAEGDRLLLAAQPIELRLLLLQLHVVQARPQHLHRHVLVLVL